MPKHNPASVVGEITDVFTHRFVVKTATGSILADVGPEGAKQVSLASGTTVELSGEQKPSELRVAQMTVNGRTIEIQHGKASDESGGKAEEIDPKGALAALRSAGLEPVDEPHRKLKHFEVRATQDGKPVEVHVGLDGEIRHIKPADAAQGAKKAD